MLQALCMVATIRNVFAVGAQYANFDNSSAELQICEGPETAYYPICQYR